MNGFAVQIAIIPQPLRLGGGNDRPTSPFMSVVFAIDFFIYCLLVIHLYQKALRDTDPDTAFHCSDRLTP